MRNRLKAPQRMQKRCYFGDVCSLRWEGINEEHKTVLVRDRKDPKKKQGNHMIVPLLAESFDIVMRQPKHGALSFLSNS